ncbi:hypothetical protein MKW98_020679 [Papaver atlanticum]|uniref:PGG domain-containing protein n=1 Tax=Papaver atlanticum TaxID=357466 RepID=A0AAD4THR0_9MAGN|nr:hypothetical protein MKW98_020679 [Papaver atlanticum]
MFTTDPQIRLQPLRDNLRKDEHICESARTFLNAFPEILSDKVSPDGKTVLHGVFMFGKLKVGKDLLDMVTPKQLAIKTNDGNTVISFAVEANNVQMVKLMVGKNSDLLLIRNKKGHIPLITAAINGDEEMLRYLYSVTPMEDIFVEDDRPIRKKELRDRDGATLITAALRVEIYDIALKLLKSFPRLASTQDNDGMTVFDVLAGKPSAFPSGNRFGFFQKCIYLIAGVARYRVVGKALKLTVPHLQKLDDKKLKHEQVAEIVDIICTGLADSKLKQLALSKAIDAAYLSVIHGIVELFTALAKSNGNLMLHRDKNGNGLLQLAVLHRQENVFKAILDMGMQHPTTAPLDEDENNILHCAAFWRPLLHLHKASGEALQMQREIQWFKEVEKVVKPKYREMKNGKGIKPEALFTKEHETLVKEGEKWVKEVSQACMVVSTLIATVMFAAAFTVPGGNDQNTGFPMFLESRAFLFFIISDAVSLFASCTSILMFFTLLTSRYAERDFLTSLPTKLILGLLFLFFSIATMLATFAATLIIVLREQYSWVYIPVIISASIPVALFGSLQFPLFIEIVMSTYGPGIFHRKKTWGFCCNTRRISTWCANNKLYKFFFDKKTRTKNLKSPRLQV